VKLNVVRHIEKEEHQFDICRVSHLGKGKRYSSPVTGLEWPRRFQEVKVPRFHDSGTGWW